MRRMLFATIIGCSAASAANAADVVSYEPAPPVAPVASVYDWSGLYIGAQGGWGWGDSNVDDNGLSSLDTTFDIDGGFLGGVVGAQWQYGSVVLGVEGEMNWSDISGTDEVQPGNVIGTDINWKEGKNTTVKMIEKKQADVDVFL